MNKIKMIHFHNLQLPQKIKINNQVVVMILLVILQILMILVQVLKRNNKKNK